MTTSLIISKQVQTNHPIKSLLFLFCNKILFILNPQCSSLELSVRVCNHRQIESDIERIRLPPKTPGVDQ